MKPPPEEKLLRLIRGKAGRGHHDPSAEAMPAAAAVVTVRVAGTRPGAPSWSYWTVWSLGGVLAAEALVLAASIIWPVGTPPVPPIPAPVDVAPVDPVTGPIAPLADIPSLASGASRPLFAPTSASATGSGGGSTAPSGSAKLLATRLSLMGLVSGEQPQAIIADSQTQKTYFVGVGQQVSEGAVVETIMENGVILNFSGEKIELSL